MSSNSFFNQKSILRIKKIHKGLLWVATGVLIASLLLGVALVFIDTTNGIVFVRIQATFSLLALLAFVLVNGLIRIEKGNKAIQGFALVGFVANILWVMMAILMVWGAFQPIEYKFGVVETDKAIASREIAYNDRDSFDVSTMLDDYDEDYYDEYDYDDYDYDYDYDYDDYDYDSDYDDSDYYTVTNTSDSYRNTTYSPSSYMPNLTIAAKITLVLISVASIGFWVSNIMAIKDKVKAVKPLKMTAIICQIFRSVFVITLVFLWPINFSMDALKWVQLYGLSVSGFIVMGLAAWIISRTHRDFDADTVDGGALAIKPAGGAGEIEEKVKDEGLAIDDEKAKDVVEPKDEVVDEVVEETVKEEIAVEPVSEAEGAEVSVVEEAPAAEAPASEAPAPEAEASETPASETLEAPAAETPAPETPAPEAPASANADAPKIHLKV